MINKLFGESFAMMMIGDGVLSLLNPKRHVLLWRRGPKFWQDAMNPFLENPNMTRVAGAVEIALGLWLATREEPEA